ncbi:MAG: hypothetical protein M0R06_19620 [Sphaerochaeta sp.]|jgi:hypothetical protein|nr:hypothetical protein [Sphaerochaeta sp.]
MEGDDLMRILDLQRRALELGRIRIGEQAQTSTGKMAPRKLETFRFTSRVKERIEAVAALHGGKIEPWEAPDGPQWQVTTETNVLDVHVPPGELSFSQAFELWSAGGCLRRCDGHYATILDRDKGPEEKPCICDPDDRECKIHTRLSLMVSDLPGLGVWRLDTQGWYAATELQGAVQLLEAAGGAGVLIPAKLRLESRTVKRGGKTHRFVVPVLDSELTPGQLAAQASQGPRLLDPVPADRHGAPPSIEAQVFGEEPSRRPTTKPELPPTDVPLPGEDSPPQSPGEGAPSTAAQHDEIAVLFDQVTDKVDPHDRQNYVTSVLGVEGLAPKDLDKGQADRLITALKGLLDKEETQGTLEEADG